MKYCTGCDNTKASEMFYKDKSKKDGLSSSCMDCAKTRAQDWYQSNPEQAKETRALYRTANPEKIKEINRACAKNWREANPQKVRESQRRWKKENPDKVNAKNQRYLTKLNLANCEISQRTLNAWSSQARAAHPYCELCLTTDNLEAHHILPKSRYPQHALNLTNAQILCADCHTDIHTEIPNLKKEEVSLA